MKYEDEDSYKTDYFEIARTILDMQGQSIERKMQAELLVETILNTARNTENG